MEKEFVRFFIEARVSAQGAELSAALLTSNKGLH